MNTSGSTALFSTHFKGLNQSDSIPTNSCSDRPKKAPEGGCSLPCPSSVPTRSLLAASASPAPSAAPGARRRHPGAWGGTAQPVKPCHCLKHPSNAYCKLNNAANCSAMEFNERPTTTGGKELGSIHNSSRSQLLNFPHNLMQLLSSSFIKQFPRSDL